MYIYQIWHSFSEQVIGSFTAAKTAPSADSKSAENALVSVNVVFLGFIFTGVKTYDYMIFNSLSIHHRERNRCSSETGVFSGVQEGSGV